MSDMEEIRKREQETEKPEQTPEKPEGEQLSPRRRSALVMYLAILFAVTFLFVALMMVFEAKRLKTLNQETSASLTSNINALQAENQKLSEKNEGLTAKVGELEDAASAAETEMAGLRAEIDRLKEEAEARETAQAEELGALHGQIEELTQKAADAVLVSELLHQAIAADEEGDLEGLQELLDQIEELKELLSPTEADIYEELKIA